VTEEGKGNNGEHKESFLEHFESFSRFDKTMFKIDEGLDADNSQLWARKGKMQNLGSKSSCQISTQSHEAI